MEIFCVKLLPHLWCVIPHFFTSAILGLLGYLLTSTMLSKYSSQLGLGESSILRISLFVGFLLAASVHLLEDYTLNWF